MAACTPPAVRCPACRRKTVSAATSYATSLIPPQSCTTPAPFAALREATCPSCGVYRDYSHTGGRLTVAAFSRPTRRQVASPKKASCLVLTAPLLPPAAASQGSGRLLSTPAPSQAQASVALLPSLYLLGTDHPRVVMSIVARQHRSRRRANLPDAETLTTSSSQPGYVSNISWNRLFSHRPRGINGPSSTAQLGHSPNSILCRSTALIRRPFAILWGKQVSKRPNIVSA